MGNTDSNVTSGVKKQAESSSGSLYGLVDLKGKINLQMFSPLIIVTYTELLVLGGGLLIELMKQASKTKDFTLVDKTIIEKVEPCLYNKGAGKMIHIAHLVLLRNRDRSKTKMVFITCLIIGSGLLTIFV